MLSSAPILFYLLKNYSQCLFSTKANALPRRYVGARMKCRSDKVGTLSETNLPARFAVASARREGIPRPKGRGSLYLTGNKFSAKILVFWAPAFNQKKLIPIWYTKSEIKKWRKQGYFIRKEKITGINYFKENKDKDYSPLLSKINAPILIIHGKKDDIVPLKFSKELAKKYKNIKLKIYPKAEHKFEDYYIQQELIKDTADWIKKYL